MEWRKSEHYNSETVFPIEPPPHPYLVNILKSTDARTIQIFVQIGRRIRPFVQFKPFCDRFYRNRQGNVTGYKSRFVLILTYSLTFLSFEYRYFYEGNFAYVITGYRFSFFEILLLKKGGGEE